MHLQTLRSSPKAPLRVAGIAVSVMAVTAGCTTDDVRRGFLPGYPDGEVTDQTSRITSLWTGSWIAALLVGLLTWGLILWCVAVYRKRQQDDSLPVQTRYHVPLEVMYTVVPVLMILVLFSATARDMTAITKVTDEPAVEIQVIAKQWSWDFNYVDADVYETGVHATDVGSLGDAETIDGAPGTADSLPTLYLPVGQKVRFELESRDVIHSFWIPAFLYKEDLIPHRTNVFEVTPTREGAYAGKCAELCGEYHSGMLFNVKVVPRAEFDAHMQELRDSGQSGQIPLDYSRQQHPPAKDGE